MKKKWIIKGKGYFNTNVTSPHSLNIQISDIETSYGQIDFTGTEQELEKIIDLLIEDESSFKMIDYFEKDSKEHREYLYGPGEILIEEIKKLYE